MANNLRYLLEHFCLDGQKIDISSQLDEENANNIEKINTQTIPSINARIDEIKDTDIPSINSRIDSIKNTDIPNINQKINTINNTTIPNVQASVTAVDEKVDRINESVAKNTRDIGTLSDNVTMQGNAINSINTEKIPSMENNINELTTKVGTINDTSIPSLQSEISDIKNKLTFSWTRILLNYNTPKGIIVTAYINSQLRLIQIDGKLSTPQSIEDGEIKDTIPNFGLYTPRQLVTSSVYINGNVAATINGVFTSFPGSELTLSFKMSSYNFPSILYGTLLYYY